MHLTLPWYLPFGLFVGLVGCRTALHIWKAKRRWQDVVFMLTLSLLPLLIWIFIQFFPQE